MKEFEPMRQNPEEVSLEERKEILRSDLVRYQDYLKDQAGNPLTLDEFMKMYDGNEIGFLFSLRTPRSDTRETVIESLLVNNNSDFTNLLALRGDVYKLEAIFPTLQAQLQYERVFGIDEV